MPDVLVVDDIVTDRLLAGGLFENASGWTVRYANDGRQGLESIGQKEPDVVVTDLMMPEMNGLELVEAIVEATPHIPVILMTSQGSEEIAVKALQNGAASYVPKRILGNELVRIVDRIVKTSLEEESQARLLNHINRTEVVELGYDRSLLTSMVNHLSQSIVCFGICSRGGTMHVRTAIDEALTNAYYHGNLELDSGLRENNNDKYFALARQRCEEPKYRDRRIMVRAELTPQKITVSIRDEGPGFNPASLPDPTDPEFICRPYGRGVMLMQTFMDEVCFNETGNEVTLVKQRRSH